MLELDQQLFLFLNGLNSPFWDDIMWVISAKLTWVPVYLAIVIYLAKKYQRKFWIIAVFIGLSVLLADQVSGVIKNTVCRPRPCHEPLLDGLVHIVNGHCGGKYGFVSSHAANCFNVAVLSSLLIRKQWVTISMVLWALVVGYSRVYLGVHYPGDVLCGSLLGIFVGYVVYRLYVLTDNKYLSKKEYFNPVGKID